MAGTASTGPRDAAPDEVGRRTTRDWFTDILCVLAAALFSVATSESVVDNPEISDTELFSQVLIGGVACLALWVRRRWPVALAVGLLIPSAGSHYVAGPLLVALFTVAVHRPVRTTAAVGTLAMAMGAVDAALHPDPELSYTGSVLVGAVLFSAAIGWGLFVRSRRQLLESLRERALRAEAEAALRAEQAQRLTRERIAREMHDVLAHRLSLLSVHAGALEYRSDASPEEVAHAAGVIRTSAHQALQDLREVIGVLRAPTVDRPQPTLRDLPRLVEESRQAGMRVTLSDGLDRLDAAVVDALPDGTGRTVYRIVQEGLTNARKHAPGAEVTVLTAGGPGEGLSVEVRNPVPDDGATRLEGAIRPEEADPAGPEAGTIPGAGAGLTGLRERAALAGGRLESGRVTRSGDFRLAAWLPWPA
ncbi:histidine kinase [Streptomyces sp. LX-29]|uniref:sensor histidine kinase n=1 Tax=Streptomyces sp. LX-29 TaxID=2900152 RepID=UPI00240E542D|nr:histidine kinase [Streptomyces sp. LX-29]WFB06904.1 histidine kinase [Streptomyces sp. LX-29]